MTIIRRILPLVLLLAAACSAAAHTSASSPMAAERASGQPAEPRAVIQQAGLRLVSDSLARIHRVADSVTVVLGGYVEDAELRENDLRMTLRVPATSLNPVLDQLSTMGRVKTRTVRRQDVTAQVVDVEARLTTLRTVRDRLRNYLGQAGATQDLVALERELARMQGEIDQLEGHQRMLSRRVELAEIRLDASRPRILGPLGWIVTGLATLIEKLFVIRG